MLDKPFLKDPGKFENIKLNKAKETLIESLYTGDPKKTGRVKMGSCPFHEDKTPSFTIYPTTNTFYCFSCSRGGDVIDFYMELNNCDFQTALEALAG